jgi:hypothetical protein
LVKTYSKISLFLISLRNDIYFSRHPHITWLQS